jgi:hypothetical protein
VVIKRFPFFKHNRPAYLSGLSLLLNEKDVEGKRMKTAVRSLPNLCVTVYNMGF